uniref:Uncharacterized protein n=1 Tax=Metapenaeus joyneri majanivirus TaxID=2984280 RepID=A0A9C7F712_9VIRU|nr:MAG: hypothetical protein [Metapenaeus joyneri majanivirus]
MTQRSFYLYERLTATIIGVLAVVAIIIGWITTNSNSNNNNNNNNIISSSSSSSDGRYEVKNFFFECVVDTDNNNNNNNNKMMMSDKGVSSITMEPSSKVNIVIEKSNTTTLIPSFFFDYKMNDNEQMELKNKTIKMINDDVQKTLPKIIKWLVDPCTCMSEDKINMINKNDIAECVIGRLDRMGFDHFLSENSSNNYYYYGNFGSTTFFIVRSLLYVCDKNKECMDQEARRIMASPEAVGEYVDQAFDATLQGSCHLGGTTNFAHSVREYIGSNYPQNISEPMTRLISLIFRRNEECHKSSKLKGISPKDHCRPAFHFICKRYRPLLGYIIRYLCFQYKLHNLI